MAEIGLVFNGVWSHYAFAKATKYREVYKLIYVHDMQSSDLDGLKALVIPFQSNHKAIAQRKDLFYAFLKSGGKMFIEGDSSAQWLDATWEDRPVNNYWWVKDPNTPPVSQTDFEHPIYQGLKPRHAFWHYHGVYTSIPSGARVIQKDIHGDIVTWQTEAYGGTLLVTTLDPIVEHGVQQITHLDNYCDRLTEWLCGIKPEGTFQILRTDYGVAL
jgi:hypothetical protein